MGAVSADGYTRAEISKSVGIKRAAAVVIIAAVLVGVIMFFVNRKGAFGAVDGSGMIYEGGELGEALEGIWKSRDGRYTLDFGGAHSFALTDNGTRVGDEKIGYSHGYSGGGLSGRYSLEVYITTITLGERPYAEIKDMWYEDGEVGLLLQKSDSDAEEILFEKIKESENTKMSIIGKWKVKEMICTSDDSLEMKPIEELLADDEDGDIRSAAAMIIEFTEDGKALTLMPIPAEATQEEIDEAVNSGELVIRDGFIVEESEWREEDGHFLYNTKIEGEAFGEEVSPWAELKLDENGEIDFQDIYKLKRAD